MRWVWIFGLIVLAACASNPTQCSGDQHEQDSCHLDLAFAENESMYCDFIENEQWRTWCFTDVAANTQNILLCDELEGSFKENCYKNVGVLTLNADTCFTIQGSAAGDACFREVAIGLNESDLCNAIDSIERYNNCNIEIAQNTADYKLCLNVRHDVVQYDGCLLRVSLKAAEPQGCALIGTENVKDLCYLNVAVKLLDKEVCDDAGSLRLSCTLAIENELNK